MSDPTAPVFEPLEKIVETLGKCFAWARKEWGDGDRAATPTRQKDKRLLGVAGELRDSMNSIVAWLALVHSDLLKCPNAQSIAESIDLAVNRHDKLLEELLELSQAINRNIG